MHESFLLHGWSPSRRRHLEELLFPVASNCPRGMAATKAVQLALGALVGADQLTPEQIQERVAGRYPESAKLPSRPALDGVLADAGWDVEWQSHVAGGLGASVPRPVAGVGFTSETFLTRISTTRTPVREVTPEVADARRFEERLEYAAAHGSFLALKVRPKLMLRAERELTARFSVSRHSVEKLLIEAMKEELPGSVPTGMSSCALTLRPARVSNGRIC